MRLTAVFRTTVQRSSEEDRGDPFIAEIDEYGLEGELPFLPRNSVAGDINFGADLNTSASDLLPTHYGPPLKRTSIGAGTAGSAADLRRACVLAWMPTHFVYHSSLQTHRLPPSPLPLYLSYSESLTFCLPLHLSYFQSLAALCMVWCAVNGMIHIREDLPATAATAE